MSYTVNIAEIQQGVTVTANTNLVAVTANTQSISVLVNAVEFATGVTGATINGAGNLIITLSNSTQLDAGQVVVPGTYGNSTVSAFLPIYSGSIGAATEIVSLTANAGAQSNQITGANAAIVTANTALKAYTDAQITTTQSWVTGANAAIVTANTALKNYVDTGNTTQSTQITTTQSWVTGANAAIVTANTALKSYVDTQDTSITSAWTSNAGAQANQIAGANAAIVTANTALKAYTDAQITTTQSWVTGANAATVTANTALKGYVDQQFTNLTNGAPAILDTLGEIATSLGNNASLSTTLLNSIAGANAAIVTANTAMKSYVDAQITVTQSSVTGANAAIVTANTALKAYTDNQITTANTALKAYVDTQDTSINTAWTANAGAQADQIAGANAAIITANTALKAYTDNQISTANTALKAYTDNQISTANTALKNYTDGQITATQSGVTGANAAIVSANTALKAYTDNQITTANTALKSYVDTQDSAITTAWTANAAAQAGQITGANAVVATLQANVGSFYTYANATFGTSSYGDSNVATYLAGNVTVGNIASTNGYFWANGTSYSSTTTATGSAGGSLTGSYPNPALATQSGITTGMFGDAVTVPQITIAANGVATSASNVSIVFPVTSGFSGNLVGNTLSASTTLRILANASPQVNVVQVGTYTQGVVVTATPSYTGANLNPANQTVVAALSGNVNFLTSWAAGTRTTVGTMAYLGVTATSANTAMNSGDRIRPFLGGLDLNLNGKNWGLLSSASNTLLPIVTNGQTQNIYGTGNMGQAAAFAGAVTITPVGGSINAQYVTGLFAPISYSTAGATYTASNINTARLVAGTITATGNLTVTNAIGLHTFSGWVSSNVSLVTNAYTVLNEDARSIIQTNGNIVSTGTANKYGTMSTFNEQVTALGSVSGTVTANLALSSIHTVTATGNITINTTDITNAVSGSSFTIVITQDGTGSRVLTSNLKYVGGTKTLSTAAGSIDVVSGFYDGTNYLVSLAKGFA